MSKPFVIAIFVYVLSLCIYHVTSQHTPMPMPIGNMLKPIDLTTLGHHHSMTVRLRDKFRQFDATTRNLNMDTYLSEKAYTLELLNTKNFTNMYDYYVNYLYHFYKFSDAQPTGTEPDSIYLLLSYITYNGFDDTISMWNDTYVWDTDNILERSEL